MITFDHDGRQIPDAPPKDVSDAVTYGADWGLFLASDEIINSSTWETQAGLTVSEETFTTKTTSFKASGGAENEVYIVTNTVTTNLNTYQRSMKILCTQL